jgi:hypothetical protein
MKSFIWGTICATLILSLAASAATPPGSGSTVGLISKVIQDVSHKQGEKDWQKAQKGETLTSGDRVKTGERSIAIIKFMDNSLVRVRELSELSVSGTVKSGSFLKSVDLQNGVVGFSIQKQRPQEEFRFSSPTSVASIRGTGGMFATSDSTDTLIVVDGTVTFFNKRTGQSVDVQAGFIGIFGPNGVLFYRPATRSELMAAEDASGSGSSKKLEFDLRDNQGKSKKLHIDIKE